MNLARIEHYFSDFLSALESRRERDGEIVQDTFPLHDQPRCLVSSGSEGEAEEFIRTAGDQQLCAVSCQGCPQARFVREQHHDGELDFCSATREGFSPIHFVPPRLEVPLNVFFTGTVNVDETTYTFSPKVLDRASVLEFKEVDLAAYYKVEDNETAPASPATGSQLQEWVNDYRFSEVGRSEGKTDPELATSRAELVKLVELLKPHDLHFGYRVADEILAFLYNANRLEAADFRLEQAMDRALLQKVIPKFHGSRSRLQRPLVLMLAFCLVGDNPEAMANDLEEKLYEELSPQDFRYPLSAIKLQSLLRALELDGFAGSL